MGCQQDSDTEVVMDLRASVKHTCYAWREPWEGCWSMAFGLPQVEFLHLLLNSAAIEITRSSWGSVPACHFVELDSIPSQRHLSKYPLGIFVS